MTRLLVVAVPVVTLSLASTAQADVTCPTPSASGTPSGAAVTAVGAYPLIGSASLWWTDPKDPMWDKTTVRISEGDSPAASVSDANSFEEYTGCGGGTIVDGLSPGTDYTFTAFAHYSNGTWSPEQHVTVRGAAVTLVGSGLIQYGQSATIRGSLQEAPSGTILANKSVSIYAHDPNSTGWTWLEDATTDAGGHWSASLAAPGPAEYEVYYYGDDTHFGAVAGPNLVNVAPTVTAWANHSKIKHGKSFTVAVGIAGGPAWGEVDLQQYSNGNWHNVKSTGLGSDGHASFSVKLKKKGTYTYRVFRPATGGFWPWTSAQFSVKAT